MVNKNTHKWISALAVAVAVLPMYVHVILFKYRGGNPESIFELLGEQSIWSIAGIFMVLLLNRYLLKKQISDFNATSAHFLKDLCLALLLLISVYWLEIVGALTWFRWITFEQPDRSALVALLQKLFSNPFYTIIFIGPATWLTQGFLELSRAFTLNNLALNQKNSFVKWAACIVIAAFFCLLSIDNGIPGMLLSFLFNMLFNICYMKYRRVMPLLYASILFQSISLIGFALAL